MSGWSGIAALVIGVIILIIAMLAIFPLVTFWAIQTIFNYQIPYNLWTAISFWILFILCRPSVAVNTKDSFNR